MVKNISFKLLFFALLFTAPAVFGQKRQDNAAQQSGRPVLWEMVDVRRQDTYLGNAAQLMPDLSRIQFIREERGGYSKKYRIRDANGAVWVAKIGREAQSETAAVRLLSALGYRTEIVHLVPRLAIPGKGTFSNVRLEARPEWVDRGKEWRWDKNPFKGTDQLQGLKIIMAMINNWDMKNSNNVILRTNGEHAYVVSDLGATFGKMGAAAFPLFRWIGRTRNKPEDYADAEFVKGVRDGRVRFSFAGKNYRQLKDITVGQARWMADLLLQLSERQIRDAFRAANYSQRDINLLTTAFRDRIEQLDRAASYGVATR
jgi:hypothetical protein